MWKRVVNKILNLFGYAIDWELIWDEQGEWQLDHVTINICYYKIIFSKSLKKYKLKISGHKPDIHPVYRVAQMYLIKLTKDLNDKSSNNDLG